MRSGMRVMKSAGVPSSFMVIPEATHGAMGPTPEKTMGEALDWLFSHEAEHRESAKTGAP
jgi:hypothetical protein